MEKRNKDIARDRNLPYWSIHKQILAGEKCRNSPRKIKYVLQKMRGGGVSRVETTNNKGDTIILTQKEEIERACMAENNEKYTQTNDTPCMQHLLHQDLHYDGLTPAGEAILNGTYKPPDGTNQYTRELLAQLKRVDTVFESIPEARMTTQHFKDGWKKIKEKTSAGISGTHFGHLKVCAEDDRLAEMEASFAHIPFMSGFSPTLWQYGVIVMIRKKANSDLLKKLTISGTNRSRMEF